MCSSVAMMAVLVQLNGLASSQQVGLPVLLHHGFESHHWCVVSTTGAHGTHTLVAHDRLMPHSSSMRLQSVVWRYQGDWKVAACALCSAAAAVLASVGSFISFCSVQRFTVWRDSTSDTTVSADATQSALP